MKGAKLTMEKIWLRKITIMASRYASLSYMLKKLRILCIFAVNLRLMCVFIAAIGRPSTMEL